MSSTTQDDEWEYEYDDTLTEDCYFTLDLTTHVPDALTRKYDAARRPPLQLLDLHTRAPLLKFDGAIYSCYWSTDLGTQFHIAHAGTAPGPIRPGTVLDVVALSQTRLIGKPITLKPNTSADRPPTPEPDNEDDTQPQPSHNNTLSDPTKPLLIPRELCKDRTAEAQAAFLEKLSAIKLAKGETDPVPIYRVLTHRDPRNRDALRKRALEDDAARRKDEAAMAADRPRKRRKRLTAQEKGLLVDDDGGDDDEENAAAAAAAVPAPVSKGRGTAGRQDRATLGARVGFEGQGPGALGPVRRSNKRRGHEKEVEVQYEGDEGGGEGAVVDDEPS